MQNSQTNPSRIAALIGAIVLLASVTSYAADSSTSSSKQTEDTTSGSNSNRGRDDTTATTPATPATPAGANSTTPAPVDDKGGLSRATETSTKVDDKGTPAATATGVRDDKGGLTRTTSDDSGKSGAVNSGSKSQSGPSSHSASGEASATARAIQGSLQKFDSVRDLTVAERTALVGRLEAAKTEAERAAIAEQFNREQALREDERRETARQIRDDVKKVRVRTKPGA